MGGMLRGEGCNRQPPPIIILQVHFPCKNHTSTCMNNGGTCLKPLYSPRKQGCLNPMSTVGGGSCCTLPSPRNMRIVDKITLFISLTYIRYPRSSYTEISTTTWSKLRTCSMCWKTHTRAAS